MSGLIILKYSEEVSESKESEATPIRKGPAHGS